MQAVKQIIEINDKKILMTFGIQFLGLMGDKYSVNSDGVKATRGFHYASIMTELQFGNPVMLFDMIRFATYGNPNLTDEEIESYVFEQISEPETERKIFDDFFDIFKKLPGAKRYVDTLTNSIAQANESNEEKPKARKKKAE